MSIWASVDLGDHVHCRASDSSDVRSEEYAGTGADELELGVATALSWHSVVRLSIVPTERGELDRDLLLTEESATVLRELLDEALRRLRKDGT